MNYLHIDVIHPGEIALPANIKELTVINNDQQHKDSKNIGKSEYLMYRSDSLTGLYLSSYVSEALNESPRFSAYFNNKTILPETNSSTIMWNRVKYVTNAEKTDAIISLEYTDVNDSVIIWEFYDGLGYYKTTEFIFTIESIWKFYFPDLQKVYQKSFTDTISLREVTDETQYLSLLTNKEGTEWLAHSIADIHHLSISEFISPHWVREKRMYYGGGRTELKYADNYISEGKWDKAAEIWNSYSESSNKRLAAICSYNMAVISESTNNIDLALTWINKSIEKVNSEQSVKYRKQLQQRKDEIEKLDKQFGN